MRPNQKGWLTEYVDLRKGQMLEMFNDISRRQISPEQSLYRILQPTGLMYGYTVGDIEFPDENLWSPKERMKILLAESLISSAYLSNRTMLQNLSAFPQVIEKTFENICRFYNNVFPELSTASRTLFGRKRGTFEIAEKILDKRIDLIKLYSGNFWITFFHNSLLFLDVYIFGQWSLTNADQMISDFFKYEREELRFSVVKIIAAASHANKEVAFEEKKLFEYFVQSTNLPSDKRKEALRIFEEAPPIEEINFMVENSWILKRFFLEIAILTLWADKKFEQSEHVFLKRLSRQLKFSDEDLENSLIAIEGFVLEHWNSLEQLQNKQDFDHVSEMFIGHLKKIADNNSSRLIKDLKGNAVLSTLLKKSRSMELSPEENESLRKGLIVQLRSIPAFSIITLPYKFLTLPMLMRILPKDLFENIV